MIGIVNCIRRQLANPGSQHRHIALGFLWVGLFVFVGKLAGAAKEMTIAWRYGVSASVDAYVFIFNLVNWPVSVWLSVLTIVLVPLAARLRTDNPGELPRFRAELLGLTLLLGLVMGLLAWWGLPMLLHAGWLGLPGAALQQGLAITGGMALLLPLGAVISLFSAWLLAAGRHRNTLFEAIPALALLVALLLPPGWVPEPLLWGTVAGFALHAAALAAPLRVAGELPAPRLAQRSPAWRAFWGGMGVMAVGQVLTTSTILIDQFFAAGLGEGALSTLSYANRLLALVLGLGATSIFRAALPVFAAANEREPSTLVPLTRRWIAPIFLIGLAILLVSWILAPWGVSILFERGAFTAQDTEAVALVFRVAALQVPFYLLVHLFLATLAAQGRHKSIAIGNAINLVVKLPLVFWLVPAYGINGLVFSTAIMYGVLTVTLYHAILANNKILIR